MRKRYYSVLNDGSSSAKTNDEKEVFLIRTDPKGKPEVSLISLEEPVEGDTNGLRDALNSSISGLKLNEEFDRKKRACVQMVQWLISRFTNFQRLI